MYPFLDRGQGSSFTCQARTVFRGRPGAACACPSADVVSLVTSQTVAGTLWLASIPRIDARTAQPADAVVMSPGL